MLRRKATGALTSFLVMGILGSTYAVEFELSDRAAGQPTPALAPAPDDPSDPSDLDSILKEIADVPLPPAAEGYVPPSEPNYETVEAGPVTGNTMPDSLVETELPPDAVGYVDDAMEDWTDIRGSYEGDDFVQDLGGVSSCGSRVGRGPRQPGWYMDFWLSQGYTWNPDNPRNNFNLPVTFNDRSNEYQMNQLYLVLGRRVNEYGSNWDIGGRIDLLYGTDYFFTQAAGLETRIDGSPKWNSSNGPRGTGAALYGLAVPQAYLELFAPVLGGVNVKVGHFYTTMGYESVMAPENFFYSHAYTMQYGEPFTQTGVLTSFGITPKLRGHFALTRGWNNWEDLNSKPGYLFGFSFSPSDVASLSATVHLGREDPAGRQQRNLYSIVYTRQLSGRLRYVFQHDFGGEANAEFDSQFNRDSAKWYGVNQYLFMDINSRLTAGLRVEWFRDQDNARVLAIPFESAVQGGNYTEVSLGLNWQAADHMMFRPEVRWDWSDVNQIGIPGDGMFDDFTDRNQFTAAMDVIFRF